MADHVLAVDLGTTATKTMLVRSDGAVVAEHEQRSELRSPAPGFAEMDPATWWSHVCESVPVVMRAAGIGAAEIAVIGVSGMVPTLIAIDASGEALYPSIQQNDARAIAQIASMRAAFPDATRRTGSAVTAQSIGPKWQWLREHQPDVAGATRCIVGSYGYIVRALTGVETAEANWALESGLRTVLAGWDDAALYAAGLDLELLPPIHAPGDIVGEVTTGAAEATGLQRGTPVIAGCADHVASAYAAGLQQRGDVLLKLGGAGDILLVVEEPVVDDRLFLDLHPTDGLWLSNGCMAASGSLLRWFERELGGGLSLAELDEEASDISPGADGLLMLPYFLGEKTPLQDPLARGTLAGLHLGHTRAHLYRAALEAVAFAFRHHLEIFAERSLDVGRARVTNGGSRSTLWKQVLADVTGLDLHVPAIAHGSSFGVALIAGDAVGVIDAAAVIDDVAGTESIVRHDAVAHDVLRPHYERWRDLEQAVRPISHALAKEFST